MVIIQIINDGDHSISRIMAFEREPKFTVFAYSQFDQSANLAELKTL